MYVKGSHLRASFVVADFFFKGKKFYFLELRFFSAKSLYLL